MSKEKPTIAVIGAGLAGLTAAYRLNQKGYEVQVYEARKRVGGRLHSVLVKNLGQEGFSIGELGGLNITDGGDAVNFLGLAKELNLEIIREPIRFTCAFHDGNKLHDMAQLLKERAMTEEEFAQVALGIDPIIHSIQAVLDRLFKTGGILKRLIAAMITGYEGSPPHLLSIDHNIETLRYMVFGGVSVAHKSMGEEPLIHLATLKDGSAALPLALAKNLLGRLHLGKVLKEGAISEDNRIQLSFKDGNAITCDKVILSMPCSVYGDISWDERIIPSQRLKQIKSVEYGTNGKILIPAKGAKGRYVSILTDDAFAVFRGDKDILSIYSVGESGVHLAANRDRLLNETLKAVKEGFNQVAIPEGPVTVAKDEQFAKYAQPVVKSWVEDPYSKGAYSNYGLALNKALTLETIYQGIKFKTIFEPIDDKVFIIGEHATILDEIGTMEAAVESGERVASLF